jgi:hypothetical protein
LQKQGVQSKGKKVLAAATGILVGFRDNDKIHLTDVMVTPDPPKANAP